MKRLAWDDRGLNVRLGMGGAAVGIALFGGQGAGIAALGTAIGVPLWVVFGAGAAFLGVLYEEITGKARPQGTTYRVIDARPVGDPSCETRRLAEPGDPSQPEPARLSACRQNESSVAVKTFSGIIEIGNLPPHFGLTVSLAFLSVADPDAPAPYDGDPPAEAITDCLEVYNEVDLNTEIQDSTRAIPFALERAAGYFYLQLRTQLYRKQDGKVFAQAEQFFYGRRPLALLDDLPSVKLPVEWPPIQLDDLGHYGTVEPQGGR
jgi:hypothetical protein